MRVLQRPRSRRQAFDQDFTGSMQIVPKDGVDVKVLEAGGHGDLGRLAG